MEEENKEISTESVETENVEAQTEQPVTEVEETTTEVTESVQDKEDGTQDVQTEEHDVDTQAENKESQESLNQQANAEEVEAGEAKEKPAKKSKEKKVKPKKEKVEKVKKEKVIKEKKVKEKKAKKVVETEEVPETELSDDELYAKIQTEKLLKRKKTKKIATLIGMCFALVLATALIVLAAVPVSLLPRCVSGDFYSVQIKSSEGNSAFTKGEEGYDYFADLLKDSFSQTYLSAIFSGTLFDYEIDEMYGKTNYDSIFGTSGKLASSDVSYVRLKYETDKTLTNQNGSKYNSTYNGGRTSWDGSFTFDSVYIVVNEEKGFRDTTIYLPIAYPVDFDYETGEVTSTVKGVAVVTVKANTGNIYENWETLMQY